MALAKSTLTEADRERLILKILRDGGHAMLARDIVAASKGHLLEKSIFATLRQLERREQVLPKANQEARSPKVRYHLTEVGLKEVSI